MDGTIPTYRTVASYKQQPGCGVKKPLTNGGRPASFTDHEKQLFFNDKILLVALVDDSPVGCGAKTLGCAPGRWSAAACEEK